MKWVNFKYKIGKLINTIKRGQKTSDDYDWELYTGIYKDGIDKASEKATMILQIGDYIFADSKLMLQNSHISPLHPVHKFMYELLLTLNPQSAMDIGFGGGDHLNNLQILMPHIKLYGIDIGEGQVQLAKKRHPDLQAHIQQYSITTSPESLSLPKVEAVYTMAVIQHIKESYVDALINLFQIAEQYVVITENWCEHDFMDDIQELFKRKKIPWQQIHFYYHISSQKDENQNPPSAMIIAAQPISFYKPLNDYKLLVDTMNNE